MFINISYQDIQILFKLAKSSPCKIPTELFPEKEIFPSNKIGGYNFPERV